MKWQLEISDCPTNTALPIIGHQVNDGGVKTGPYYLSVETVIQALQQTPEIGYDADGMRLKENNTPTFPFGTIRYSTDDTGKFQRVTMMIPKQQFDIRYGEEEREFYHIGFPKMVIQFLVESDKNNQMSIRETRLYAIKDCSQPITDDTQLYVFPYPNVGKDNGIVCWGQNQRLTIKDIVELERAFAWFLSAPFNEDHGIRSTLKFRYFREMIEGIKELPFDDEWLLPHRSTFGDLFN
ncbi:MAG: hypothetical protein R3267_06545 [Paenisporosarcina sp.]|nr:hypothetical protein [Paenisporosarcina sp.]